MAAKIPSTKRPLHKPHTSKSSSTARKPSSRPSSSSTTTKSKPRSTTSSSKSRPSRPPPTQQKTKPNIHNPSIQKRKAPRYTDKQLNLPTLNTIVPAGVTRPRGKKKGKIFVDDKESMMTILAVVNAEQEGKIESKMMRLRQLEVLREARRVEEEKRREGRKEEFEGLKKEVKGSGKKRREERKGLNGEIQSGGKGGVEKMGRTKSGSVSGKKRVSFA